MKKQHLLYFLFTVSFTAFTVDASEIVFSYKGPQGVSVKLFQNGRLLKTLAPGDKFQIPTSNGKYIFEAQIETGNYPSPKPLEVLVDNNRVDVNIVVARIGPRVVFTDFSYTKKSWFVSTSQSQPDRIWEHLERGDEHFDNNAYDQAIAEYTAAIRINSNFWEAYFNRGLVYLESGNYDRAILDFTQALRIVPNDAAIYNNRGIAYYNKGEYDRAIADYETALRISPNDSYVRNNIEIARQARAITIPAPQPHPPPRPARITIVNNTGYTVRKVFINPTTSSTWGPNRLGSQILYDWHSITLNLPYSLNQENWYDIKLEDSGNHTYIRKGVNVAVNDRIEFSRVHIDRRTVTPPAPRPALITPDDSYLKTIGFSIGSSFATPLLIFTLHGTHAPVRNMYLEYGFDLGLIHDGPNNSEIYSVVDYYSIYPFANVGYFRPFEYHEGGWYVGGGVGYMFSKYTFADGTTDVHRVALNFTTGFIIWDKVNVSYTLRTNFVGANNKLSVGLIHRFD